jgi:hypothetical protein
LLILKEACSNLFGFFDWSVIFDVIIIVEIIEYWQERRLNNSKNTVQSTDQFMPNFFDTLRVQDIIDYINDERDFSEVGH